MKKNSRARALFFEGLEDRRLLATASVSGGILKIVGTSAADVVTINDAGSPGSFDVTYQKANGDEVFKNFTNVRGLNIDLKGGNDTLNIGTGATSGDGGGGNEAVELLGPVIIKLGAGSDTADLYINTIGAVTVDGGVDSSSKVNQNQNDSVIVEGSIINTLVVNTYAGSDSLTIENSAILNLVANLGVGSLKRNQTDSDAVNITGSAVGIATITLGTAENAPQPSFQIAQAGPFTPGRNTVSIDSTVFGNLTIVGGNKSDLIDVNSGEILFDDEGNIIPNGIGAALPDMLVDLVDDLEPLLHSLAAQYDGNSLLSSVDSLLSSVDSLLPGFDLSQLNLSDIDLENDDFSDLLAGFFFENDISGLGDFTTVYGNAVISTLGGSDFVNVDGVAVQGTAVIALGLGDDDLRIANSFANRAVFDGGPGFDFFIDGGNNSYNHDPVIINFEDGEEEEVFLP